VVQLLVSLVATPDRVPELLYALRMVTRSAEQAIGCTSAQVFNRAGDTGRIVYVEEWDDAARLRAQFATHRFVRLLELLEASTERPNVEFRVISETHGLEYVEAEQHQATHVG
jgi:quinol monooxygenase YgiN